MMRWNLTRLAALPVFLFAGLAACERQAGPTAVEGLAPAHTVSDGAGGTYTLVTGSPGSSVLETSATIDFRGGELLLGGHVLSVPRNAVSQPTLFRMRLKTNGYLEVDLKATRTGANGQEIDVGAAGFATPVRLKMSYETATNVADANRLKVLYEVDDTPTGRMQLMGGDVDTKGKWVAAWLPHFSGYVMATN